MLISIQDLVQVTREKKQAADLSDGGTGWGEGAQSIED